VAAGGERAWPKKTTRLGTKDRQQGARTGKRSPIKYRPPSGRNPVFRAGELVEEGANRRFKTGRRDSLGKKKKEGGEGSSLEERSPLSFCGGDRGRSHLSSAGAGMRVPCLTGTESGLVK